MEIFLGIYIFVIVLIGIYTTLTTISNIIFFKKIANVKPLESSEDSPLVSIIIPARDEEENLGRLLDSLIAQTYTKIEILVINDQSSDMTQQIIEEYEKKDSRIHGYKTEAGVRLSKHGKMNALLQLIPYAKGEYMLATDADTQHEKEAVSRTVKIMQEHNLDIISGFPTEICPTYMASINVSTMMFANTMVPHSILYKVQLPQMAFAIGQFILMRRDAYYEVGGYGCITNEIVDDMGLVKLFVKRKKKYAFVNMSRSLKCFMYHNGEEAFKGISRSIIGVIPAKPWVIHILIVIVCALMLVAWVPLFVLIFSLLGYFSAGLLAALIGWVLFCMAWFVGCRNINFRIPVSLSCPLSITMICAMYIYGLYRKLSGKDFIWKGRKI